MVQASRRYRAAHRADLTVITVGRAVHRVDSTVTTAEKAVHRADSTATTVERAVHRAEDVTEAEAAALLIHQSRQSLRAPVSRIRTIIKTINMIRGIKRKICR